jgi:hypothetical protein
MAKTSNTHNRPLSGEAQAKENPKRPRLSVENQAKENVKKPALKELSKPSKPAVQRVPLSSKPLGTVPNGGVRKPVRASDPTKLRREKELNIEDIVEKKVEEILAARALNGASTAPAQPQEKDINEQVNRRLEMLEKKLEKKADARAEGLTYILLAKQHAQRGEDFAALSMYRLALGYFPDNAKLLKKISDLEEKRKNAVHQSASVLDDEDEDMERPITSKSKQAFAVFMDAESPPRPAKRPRSLSTGSFTIEQSPRTRQLLRIINSEDVDEIMKLKVCLALHGRRECIFTNRNRLQGVGKKRAEALAAHVRELREKNDDFPAIKDLEDLGLIKGIGSSFIDKMRTGISC